MIFAVAMTFIDQTIVSIAVPEIQKELHLSSTGVQWVVNGYLLSLAALFAFGGRLSDIVGHTRMVVIGVVIFAVASTACGLTPANGAAEAWIISWRVVQGAGGALMYPAALALVVSAFPLAERGKAMALFFGVAGGLTAIGPILGGYLTQWTWRAIFWVNIPVAIVALILTYVARPTSDAPRVSYGEATGITQTVRNLGASLGLAVLGTVLIDQERSHLTATFASHGVPAATAGRLANTIAQSRGASGARRAFPAGTNVAQIYHQAQLGFAQATQSVLYGMRGIMAAATLVGLVGLQRGRQEMAEEMGAAPAAT